MELSNGRTIGFEALVRWDHPTRGLLRPDEFIPIVEESDLIDAIGRWVLDRACTDLARWTAAYLPASDLYMSVNVSARQLTDSRIVSDVQHAIADADIPAGRLVLEITETALMHDVDAARVLSSRR